jgi:hypothetical protein
MKRWIISGLMVAVAAAAVLASPASAYSNSRNWLGHGSYEVESAFTLDTEICGIENGAPVDGPYTYWVLTASRATNADISINGGTVMPMVKSGNGSFNYLQDLDTWVEPTSATATFDGSDIKRVNLTLGHGCSEESVID